MGIELKIYENPRLVTEVRNGQVIEAMPGSWATATKEKIKNFGSNGWREIITEVTLNKNGCVIKTPSKEWASPEGIEEYSRCEGGFPLNGEFPTNIFGYVRGIVRSERAYAEQGDFLVERLLPFGEPYDDHLNRGLGCWSLNKKNVYFLVGELTGFEGKIEDGFSPFLMDDSIKLTPGQTEVIRNDLLRFKQSRKGKDYAFTTPEGKNYSLSEIILSIK